ncbi:hypothetical protein IT402_00795 [Candidatus Nomurabacteria bacterium]|nr:hypothetical protein [Candidatus Nomurabacteria bacterium]
MNLETGMYLENPDENDKPSFSEEEYKRDLESRSEEDLLNEELSTKESIDKDIENEFKKKNALNQGIPEDALTSEVKNAEALHNIHNKKLEILKSIKKVKSNKGKKGPFLGSFFGF